MRTHKGLALLLCISLLLLACDLSSAIRPPATGSPATPAGPAGTPTRLAAPTAAPTLPSKPSADPTTLTYDANGDPDTLDTAFDYETTGGGILQNLYDTLVFYNKDKADRFVPQLATSVPSQANGGISADGKTYTFQIRTGVKFHNGDSLTPADVAYTFQRGLLQGGVNSPQWLLVQPLMGAAIGPNNDIADLFDPTGAAAQSGNSAAVQLADPGKLAAACQQVAKAVVADDGAGTVTFHLAQPWAPFLATLAGSWASIQDKKWVSGNGGWDGDCRTWQKYYAPDPGQMNLGMLGKGENGTGPYRLDHWNPGVEIVLRASDDYWRTQPLWPGGPSGTPRLKTIRIELIQDSGVAMGLLANGTADLHNPYLDADWSRLDGLAGETCDAGEACKPGADPSQPLRKFQHLPGNFRHDINFNLKINPNDANILIGSGKLDGKGIPPDFFSDVHIRRAFSYCFDSSQFIQKVYNGDAVQSYDAMLPGELGYSASDPHYSFDTNECKAEFQAANLKSATGQSVWDTGFEMTLPFVPGAFYQVGAESLAAAINAVNPKFKVKVVGMPVSEAIAMDDANQLPLAASHWTEDIHDPNDLLAPYVVGAYVQTLGVPADLLKKFRDQINQGAETTDPAQRAAIYQQFNRDYYDAALRILTAVPNQKVFERRWVQGFYYNPDYLAYFYALSKQ